MRESEDKEEEEKRQNYGLTYERVVAHLYEEAENLPKDFKPRLRIRKGRFSAKGYANTSVWSIANLDGKLSDVDVGFVLALEALAQKIAFLEHRITMLENR